MFALQFLIPFWSHWNITDSGLHWHDIKYLWRYKFPFFFLHANSSAYFFFASWSLQARAFYQSISCKNKHRPRKALDVMFNEWSFSSCASCNINFFLTSLSLSQLPSTIFRESGFSLFSAGEKQRQQKKKRHKKFRQRQKIKFPSFL